MSDERRHKRLRGLIGRLNKQRKKQAKQIDLLCNDFITAQKEFIKSLNAIRFAADFYEATAGLTDLNELLNAAADSIKNQIKDVSIAFFLPTNKNFEMHIFEADQQLNLQDRRIENFFTAELVNEICKSNKICTMDDMLAMGLAGPPTLIEKISAAALALTSRNVSCGFILIYRGSQRPLSNDEIQRVWQITPGLARSIAASRSLVSSAEPV